MFKFNRKGFTLIEMLIVIVIIGLLASSLIPKIVGMQAKARDTARAADVKQVSTALQVYYSDNGSYPVGTGPLSTISSQIGSYLGGLVPKDPQASRVFSGITSGAVSGGEYGYTRVIRGGVVNGGFAVMAGTEERGSATNRVSQILVTEASELNVLTQRTCTVVTLSTGTNLGSGGNGACTALTNSDVLRFIYLQG